ncbi:MAG TPA: hypothetical protein VFX65_14215 [Candidatus Limnocylindrales bacterium]|nr:hypothetical protein [Candidatus Limnocylindrales bacterium]
MCMNCGCGKPDDEHGNPANITAAELRKAGAANGQSLRTSAQNILDTVDIVEGRDPMAAVAGAGAAARRDSGGAERGTPATES